MTQLLTPPRRPRVRPPTPQAQLELLPLQVQTGAFWWGSPTAAMRPGHAATLAWCALPAHAISASPAALLATFGLAISDVPTVALFRAPQDALSPRCTIVVPVPAAYPGFAWHALPAPRGTLETMHTLPPGDVGRIWWLTALFAAQVVSADGAALPPAWFAASSALLRSVAALLGAGHG